MDAPHSFLYYLILVSEIFFSYNRLELRFMNGRLRIAVTELSLSEKNNQSLGDYGFSERVA